MIRSVQGDDQSAAKSALEELCKTYWFPLYSFVQHQGHQAQTAADLTQAFFEDLLARNDLNKVDPKHGKFRSFIVASLKHFLLNEWDKQQAQKRGGNRNIFSIDYDEADQRYRNEPVHENTSDKVFERQWALTLIERTNRALAEHFESLGKAHQFEKMKIFLAGKSSETTLGTVAGQLGMTEVALKVAVHRMRQKFGELLRLEIEQTVDSPGDIDEEIQHLFGILSHQ